MKARGDILPQRLRLPALFVVLLLGAAACFAVGFFVARFIGASHSPTTMQALGAEVIVALVLAVPYSVIGMLASLSGKNWRVFASILLAHLIIVGSLFAHSYAIGIKIGVLGPVFALVGLGVAQAGIAEYSFRWIIRLWKNT